MKNKNIKPRKIDNEYINLFIDKKVKVTFTDGAVKNGILEVLYTYSSGKGYYYLIGSCFIFTKTSIKNIEKK